MIILLNILKPLNMKYLNITLGLFSRLAIFTVLVFLTSCEQEEIRLDSITETTNQVVIDRDIIPKIEPSQPANVQLIETLGYTPKLLCNLTKPGMLYVNLHSTKGQQLRTIYEAEATTGPQQINIDKGNLPRGIYFVHVIFVSTDGTVTNKSLKLLI